MDVLQDTHPEWVACIRSFFVLFAGYLLRVVCDGLLYVYYFWRV